MTDQSVQKMETAFVHQFCTKMASINHVMSEMRAFYNFGDKRPGSVVERITQDATRFAEHQKLFQP